MSDLKAQTSRVIIKNIPNYIQETNLRQLVENNVGVKVTDAKILKNAQGKSRRFAFVGLLTHEDAARVIKALNNTFVDTSRLTCLFAHAPGSQLIPRAWSRYTKGTTANARAAKTSTHKREAKGEESTTGDPSRKKAKKGRNGASEEKADFDTKQSDGDSLEQNGESENGSDVEADPLSWLRQQAESAEKAQEGSQSSDEQSNESNCRLLILNIPYDASESEFTKYCEGFGKVEAVSIPLDSSRLRNEGRAFVTFGSHSEAVKALESIPSTIFGGRLLKAEWARPKEELEETRMFGKVQSSYKRKLQKKLTKNAESPVAWNLLYLSPKAALEAAASEKGLSVKQLLSTTKQSKDDDTTLPARVALTEADVIGKLRSWMEEQQIDVKVCEGKGVGIRSDDTIVVKNLPAFAERPYAVRLCLAPFGATAIVQFLHSQDAKKAFKRLAYSRFKDSPLFLEWAPHNLFLVSKPPNASCIAIGEQEVSPEPKAPELPAEETPAADSTSNQPPGDVSVYIKNLSFQTTEAALKELFETAPGFVQVKISKKKKAVKLSDKDSPNEVALSSGYGFAHFSSVALAEEAIQRFQSVVVDNHALKLEMARQKPKTDVQTATAEVKGTKLLIKNAHGNVVAVRLPKKADGSLRGYAFVEYSSPDEATTAKNALGNAHLYGRRLVIDFAKEESPQS